MHKTVFFQCQSNWKGLLKQHQWTLHQYCLFWFDFLGQKDYIPYQTKPCWYQIKDAFQKQESLHWFFYIFSCCPKIYTWLLEGSIPVLSCLFKKWVALTVPLAMPLFCSWTWSGASVKNQPSVFWKENFPFKNSL